MFRFLDNLPEVYINESRDFQVFARVSDILFSGLRYDIDTMVNILDAALIKDRMLELLCTKVGFFPRREIDAQVLKYIVASFPYILKNKGNEEGIKAAVNAILKAENVQTEEGVAPVTISIITKDTDYNKAYTVFIYTSLRIINTDALSEVLRYVLPAGFTYMLFLAKDFVPNQHPITIVKSTDKATVLKTTTVRASALRTSNDNKTWVANQDISDLAKRNIGSYGAASIVNAKHYEEYWLNEEVIEDIVLEDNVVNSKELSNK